MMLSLMSARIAGLGLLVALMVLDHQWDEQIGYEGIERLVDYVEEKGSGVEQRSLSTPPSGTLTVELRGHGGIVGQFLATPQAHVDPLLKTSL